jgi:type IV pilus assembly protein PilP
MKRLLIVLAIAGCGDDDGGKSAPPPPRPSAPAAPSAPPSAGATPVDALKTAQAPQTPDGLIAEVRKRQLTSEDFKESDTNRDPFRSYLSTFSVGPVKIHPQHKIVLDKFGIDELKLVAIVNGDGVPPKAMFVDPAGKGVTIMRGDHVSKLDALVVRISPDRVFFQYEEDAGNGKTRTVERVVELHAGELVNQ